MEHQIEYRTAQHHHQPLGYNQRLQDTSPNNSRISTLVKFPWNIYQDSLYILGQEKKNSKFKELKPFECVFQPQCNEIKIKSKKLSTKFPTGRLNNTLLNNPWIKEKVLREIFLNILNQIKMKIHHIKICKTQLKQQWQKFIANL